MSRRKKESAADVTLRLTQNELIQGALAKAGTEFTFSQAEALKRIRTQQFWEIA